MNAGRHAISDQLRAVEQVVWELKLDLLAIRHRAERFAGTGGHLREVQDHLDEVARLLREELLVRYVELQGKE
uniref:Uncharacterized protein n=1 Tax=viral metagenome TaxID=1070528 RepID=A0A6H1ZSA6_9ZZZZ